MKNVAFSDQFLLFCCLPWGDSYLYHFIFCPMQYITFCFVWKVFHKQSDWLIKKYILSFLIYPSISLLPFQFYYLKRLRTMTLGGRRWRSQTLAWHGSGTRPPKCQLLAPTPGWPLRSLSPHSSPKEATSGGTASHTHWPGSQVSAYLSRPVALERWSVRIWTFIFSYIRSDYIRLH